MSEQPPVQPPSTPPQQPSDQPTGGNPPTQPMPAAPAAPPSGTAGAPGSAHPPGTNVWHQATSTPGRRLALGLSAAAVAILMILGIGVAGLLVLRNSDRVGLLGSREGGQFLRQDGPGNGKGNGKSNGNRKGFGDDRGPGADDGDRGNLPGLPGMPRGRDQGLGGLGALLGGTALHGEVTATVNGTAQAVVFQRGEVTAVSDTSVTLKSSDGFAGTYGRNAATRSRGAALVKGGQAFVLARASDKVAITTLALPPAAGSGSSS